MASKLTSHSRLKLACKAAFGVNLSGNNQENVLADIMLVLSGVKPAFLVDCASTTGEKFQVLLSEVCYCIQTIKTCDVQTSVEKSHCAFKSCCIVTLNEDVLLVNLEAHINIDRGDGTGDWPCYVNIEQGQTCYHTVTKLDSTYHSIEGIFVRLCDELKSINEMSNSEHKKVERHGKWNTWHSTETDKEYSYLTPCCNCACVANVMRELHALQGQGVNLCTLFGRLLGYPVVYWFDPDIGHSLNMVDLVCFTVTVKMRQHFNQHQKCIIDIFHHVCYIKQNVSIAPI